MRKKIAHLKTQPHILAVLGLVLATLCWGGNLVAGRMSVGDIPPIALSFWRWALTFLILFSFTGKKLVRQRKLIFQSRYQLLILGFFSITCFNTLLYIAAQSTQAVNLGLIQIVLPVITMILAIPLLNVFPKKRQLFGMGMALPGLLTIFSKGEWSSLASLDFGRGDMIMFFATCCWGSYTVLLKRFELPVSGAQLLTTLVGIGVLILLPFYLWELSSKGGFIVSPKALFLISYAALFASLVAYMSWNFGVSILGANTAAMFNFLIPVFSAMFAIPILGETLYQYHLIGAGLIFTGLWITNRKYSSTDSPG
ncbi:MULTISPECIES: DMT family transporter [unclassified Endozoicomonas]|uniref:DMT family transporter n=1 Tax=unclassified Endozoicomonas TaxID=2644528 RepID=UPI0021495187|nr:MULTISPECIES: DMT family transporter [unclassified Endozoicomonas]